MKTRKLGNLEVLAIGRGEQKVVTLTEQIEANRDVSMSLGIDKTEPVAK